MGAVFIYLPVGITAVIGFACGVGYVIRENRRKKRRRARDLAIADLAQLSNRSNTTPTGSSSVSFTPRPFTAPMRR